MQEAERGQSWHEANQTATNIGREIGDDDWMASTDSEGVTSAGRPKGKKRKSAPDSAPRFSIGDSVRVESLGVTGEIVELDRSNRAVIMSGNMRFQARPHMMTLVKAAAVTATSDRSQTNRSSASKDGSYRRRGRRPRRAWFARPHGRIDDPAVH